jgi:hypothetical protein
VTIQATEQPLTEEIRDFTKARRHLKFRVDDDVFEAPSDIPAMVLLEFARRFESLGEVAETAAYIEATQATIEMVLLPESAARFVKRMSDPEKPISLLQINEIVPWLMEEYAGRPLKPSSDSSDGQSAQVPGTSSTDGSPPLT